MISSSPINQIKSPSPPWIDLLKSRSRSFLPIIVILSLGLTAYFFFSSISPSNLSLSENDRNSNNFLIPQFPFQDATPPPPPPPRPPSRIDQVHKPFTWAPTKPQDLIPLDSGAVDPETLMRLPILRHTSDDAFDPINQFKPLRDSKKPWPADSLHASLLNDRLSPQRFSEPDQTGTYSGSSPPPEPIWPKPSILRPKSSSLRDPIPTEKVHGIDFSYVWADREKIAGASLPRIQWEGFLREGWETEPEQRTREQRRGWVRRAFQHVWEGYKAKAWGHDELKPVIGSFEDPFSGWGATLVDCLDTLLIMNMTREYNYARTHVKALDWAHAIDFPAIKDYFHRHPNFDEAPKNSLNQPLIPFFETVIRYVGGLISAYDLSGDKLMLDRVDDLAQWLLPAFGTESGLPILRYPMGTNPSGSRAGRACLAEIGSLTLEFTRLAQLTGKDYYYNIVQRITDILDGDQWKSQNRPGTLFPTYIDPDFPTALTGEYTLGGMADSYYEYLIKEYQLLRGTNPQYKKMFESAVNSVRLHLVRTFELEPSGGKNLTIIGDLIWGRFRPAIDHLTCFAGGMIGLGSRLLNRDDMDLALGHSDACVWAYESSKAGVGPEKLVLIDGDESTKWRPVKVDGKLYRELKGDSSRGASIQDGRYLGRPETIESVFYMWRITGDRKWQDRGWRMFTNWVEASITEFGFADLKEVGYFPPLQSDKQESFVVAETLKYYYLLFSEPDLISLDDYVFNTEAHPFRVSGNEEEKLETMKRIKRWRGPDSEIDKRYDPPEEDEEGSVFASSSSSSNKEEKGYGTVLQQWSRVNFEKVTEDEAEDFKKVFGFR